MAITSIGGVRYETVIGLEIHAELLTKTKLFCECKNAFDSAENENICPGCLALPGTLPLLNRAAVELAVRAGLTLGSDISRYTSWDRKNYFYPDLTKAYQVTQFFAPICVGGGLDIGGHFIRLDHIHLEEDAGKLVHDNLRNVTRIDFNRCGVPLIEIVTKPDIRSSEEAAAFVEKVRLALVYAGITDGKMEQGSLRCDANISVMPEGSSVFGTRVEIKNLNSFRFITQAIEYEARRQVEALESGEPLTQETRRFANGVTTPLRSKEDATDYRYFPDADIPPIKIDDAYISAARASLGESPEAKKARYINELAIAEADVDTLLQQKFIADFFDEMVSLGATPRESVNLIRGEILRHLGSSGDAGNTKPVGCDASDLKLSPADAVKLLGLVAADKISANNMKKAVAVILREGGSADDVVTAHSMLIMSDPGALAAAVKAVLDEFPDALNSYRAGEQKVFGFFMGQCQKRLKGSAHPKAIDTELRRALLAISETETETT